MNTNLRETKQRERESGQKSVTQARDGKGRRGRVWQWVVLGVVGALIVGAGTTYLAYARDMRAIRDRLASVTQPFKVLKAFRRVTLEPGERQSVEFTLGPDTFRIWNAAMERVVEPGEFEIMTGPNSVDLESAVLTIAP